MILIPAGPFSMGCSADDTQCGPQEHPLHTVTLDAYYIDKYEVTNDRYRACVNAGVCTPPSDTTEFNNSAYGNHPVVWVNWYQADTFCQWEDKRLPTEAEREKAARGPDDTRIFPWGNQPADCSLANVLSCYGGTSPVGHYPAGASPYGVMDMAGNAQEWVADWYDANYYSISPSENPQGPATGTQRTVRDGGWDHYVTIHIRTSERSGAPADRVWFNIGMRCAADAEPQAPEPLLLDLSISAADIRFEPTIPQPGEVTTLKAIIRNLGLVDAANVRVHFLDLTNTLGQVTLPHLPAGQSAEVTIQTTFADTSLHLIAVKVDPENVLVEFNEANNEASKLLQVGDFDLSQAAMVIQATAPTVCRGSVATVSGQASYDFAEVPGQNDHPVQGGAVKATIFDPNTNAVLGTFSGAYTDINGAYSLALLAPTMDAIYPVRIEITDKTITRDLQATLTVNGACPETTPTPPDNGGGGNGGNGGHGGSGTPPSDGPAILGDLYVHAEDIVFSNSNPDADETFNIFAYIHYYGTEPVTDVPVTIYDIFPLNGALVRLPIGTREVSFANGGSGPAIISLDWTANPQGAHLIQVVIEPPFAQFTQNDKATRLLLVGDLPQLELVKDVLLLVDADSNGIVSPGDRLQYRIQYSNNGAAAATNARIIDDFDDELVTAPTQISHGGTIVNGTIVWDIGTLVAGPSGEIRYEVNLPPPDQFPAGQTVIENIAILTAEDMPAVADSLDVPVVINRVPSVLTHAAQVEVDEGGNAVNSGAVSDPDGHTVQLNTSLGTVTSSGDGTWLWSFDADDGPAQGQVVTVYTEDNHGGTSSVTFELIVQNVPPAALFGSTGPVPEGSAFILSLTNPSDPSDADVAAGFTYAFNCGNGYSGFGAADSVTCHTSDNGTRLVAGKIRDKDDDATEYTAELLAENAPPAVGPVSVSPAGVIEVGTTINAAAGYNDPGTADTHICTLNWGDAPEDVTGMVANGQCSGSHTYTSAGVHTIVMEVVDDDGGIGSATYQFIVVYDPSGGFVTGGGWIDSPLGAVVADPTITGKANFGFVSKYQKGKNVPTGPTEFQFKLANLTFYSNVQEWLVVNQAGTNAQFKGAGTINGQNHESGVPYKFMIWAGDGSPDTFRIRIWWEDAQGAEHTVYDNGTNQALGGGSIVIHKAAQNASVSGAATEAQQLFVPLIGN